MQEVAVLLLLYEHVILYPETSGAVSPQVNQVEVTSAHLIIKVYIGLMKKVVTIWI